MKLPWATRQTRTLRIDQTHVRSPPRADGAWIRSEVRVVPATAVSKCSKVSIQKLSFDRKADHGLMPGQQRKSSSAAASRLTGFLQPPIPNPRGDETGEANNLDRISGYPHHLNGL